MDSLFNSQDDVRINARLFAAGYTLTFRNSRQCWLCPDKKEFLSRDECLARLDKVARRDEDTGVSAS
jgi:hypothetical protein